MKRLLCSYTTQDEVITCRAYFVTSAHRQTTWDGQSPLDADLQAVVRSATDYARDRLGLVGPVREVRLAHVGQERYYYFSVDIEGPAGADAQEVILDLDGRVIEPEIRCFEDEEEYYRYLDAMQEKPGAKRLQDQLQEAGLGNELDTLSDFPFSDFLDPSSDSSDPTVFIQQSVEGLRTQTAVHAVTWHLGEEANWAADQDAGRIRFTFSDGTVAEGEFQIIGTYNTVDGTFLWGWDHPSVAEPLSKHASLAKEFGEKHGLANYTDRKVECSEDDAWEFAAVAARLANANGAYRGPAGTALVYMTFGAIKLRKP
jgi:hypothetical protein